MNKENKIEVPLYIYIRLIEACSYMIGALEALDKGKLIEFNSYTELVQEAISQTENKNEQIK